MKDIALSFTGDKRDVTPHCQNWDPPRRGIDIAVRNVRVSSRRPMN